MNHVETIRQLYEMFGRGDLPGILEMLAEDVEWDYGLTAAGVPWLEPRRGRAGARQFFEALAAFDLHRFQPKTFLQSGNTVVVLIDVELTVKATGRRVVEEDEIHIWRFDEAGRIARFTHKLDTHQHWLAVRGAAAGAA